AAVADRLEAAFWAVCAEASSQAIGRTHIPRSQALSLPCPLRTRLAMAMILGPRFNPIPSVIPRKFTSSVSRLYHDRLSNTSGHLMFFAPELQLRTSIGERQSSGAATPDRAGFSLVPTLAYWRALLRPRTGALPACRVPSLPLLRLGILT